MMTPAPKQPSPLLARQGRPLPWQFLPIGRRLLIGFMAIIVLTVLVRLLLVGIALLLRNAWVWFHLVRLAHRTPTGRIQLHLGLLQLATLLLCLQHYAESLLGWAEPIECKLNALDDF